MHSHLSKRQYGMECQDYRWALLATLDGHSLGKVNYDHIQRQDKGHW